MSDYNPEEDKQVAYDLRPIYAKLVGEHMADITIARKENNYFNWFKALEDLYTVTRFKFDEPDKAKKEYDEKRKVITLLANKFPTAWNGKSNEPSEIQKIDSALRELEDWLYVQMEGGALFGKGYRYDQDEL